ncbi:uncharacterized protein [Dysidea avara]|uniref:uncharacterized protein isoform X2 n=1 Tax=Dysidea avara TaxID=196820 RepID=UPI00332ADFBD
MDFKPLRLGVTFCDTRFLVAVSPLSTIADLKEEITRVYAGLTGALENRSESQEGEATHIQDGRGYLVSDDYQVGLVFDHVDTLFALTKSQLLDKYSAQWSTPSCPVTPQSSRSSVPASSNISTAVQIGSPVVKSPFTHLSIGSVSKTSKVKETTTIVRKDEEESDASETDCSVNLIPEPLEGSSLVTLNTESTKDKAKHSTQVKAADTLAAVVTAQTKSNESAPVTINDTAKKADTLPSANSSKKKTIPVVNTDSDLTSSDSDFDVTPTTKKGRSEGKPPKVNTKQLKVIPKKKSSKKQTQGQNITSTSEAVPSDKTKISDSDEATVVESQATTTKKLKAKRKLDKALSAIPEKKSKKKYTSAISKKELELANTSSQSLILDNEELWTE